MVVFEFVGGMVTLDIAIEGYPRFHAVVPLVCKKSNVRAFVGKKFSVK